ncbi:MAG: 23S rRNA (adenine(2503)-C(2))-methyltransferase RlmN [Bacillota bacterium]
MKKILLNYRLDEMKKIFADDGIQSFRAIQVNEWILKGVDSFDEMKNLSKKLKEELEDLYEIGMPKIHSKMKSDIDGTTKYLLELGDKNLIESVLMKYKHGYSACISSQVGCRMGCKFCASSDMGLVRNLSCGEMVAQVILMQADIGERISNVVVMGIGEPFDNYENFIGFLKLIHDENNLNLGYRHITVSTSGLVDKIISLADTGIPINLSVSLHTPNNDERSKIMPINNAVPIDKLVAGCKIYIEKTNRRITFEYALIKDFNDSINDALALFKLVKSLNCLINIIPINAVSESEFSRTTDVKQSEFVKTLEKRGIAVTVRRELGTDISAACGQLRRRIVIQGDNE